MGFPDGACGEEPSSQCKRQKRYGFDPSVRKILWRSAWQPTPVFLPGEFLGQRSLEGYSPQGRKESDTAEATQHACCVPTHAHIDFFKKTSNFRVHKCQYYPLCVLIYGMAQFLFYPDTLYTYINILSHTRAISSSFSCSSSYIF